MGADAPARRHGRRAQPRTSWGSDPGGSRRWPVESIRLCAYVRCVVAELRSSDLEAVLGFIHDARSPDALQPLTQTLLDRLTEVVGCDLARYKEIDLAKRIEIAYVPCTAEVRAFGFDDVEMTDQEWDDFFEEPCNRAARWARSGLFSFSELVSRGRVRARDIPIWERELGLEGCVDRMWIGIQGLSYAGVALDRGGRPFCERDRLLARVLQPHLTDLWREASVRRRLRATHALLDRDASNGFVLIGHGTVVESASPSARRLLREHFGAETVRLPEPIIDWLGSTREPLVIRTEDRVLFVEADQDASALMLSERPAVAEQLTPREREIMRCVADGLSNAEIARRLWIAPSTVRKHLENIFDKVGARNRTAALAKLRPSDLQLVG
jgi:DNA-binding CsgD family transcriptional regulator